MSAPAVSVAMVTFEQERFIAEAIESVLAQEFTDWEIVVGDDHSGDATVEVARFYQRAHPTRVRILSADTHMGPRANYIRTLGACRGRYIVQLDGDDYFTSPQKLATQVEFLDTNPDCALTFHASIDVDDVMHGLGKSFIFAGLITLVGVVNGAGVSGGAEGLGRATTRSVVQAITAIIITDMLFVFVVTR